MDSEEKEVKIYIRHSQKNLRNYICCVVFKGVFRTQLNIHDGAFLRKQLTAFGRYFCKSAPSYMRDWVLNGFDWVYLEVAGKKRAERNVSKKSYSSANL